MRLIDCTTLEIEEFHEIVTPQYAILSHTWETEEVSFQDVQSGNFKHKRGWSKIERCCAQALERKIKHAWVDTCCIDKSSSAELQESINSMFRWYRAAKECYAYLADVPDEEGPEQMTAFRTSRWWTRGWTLQELIAPKEVLFYSSGWSRLGTRNNQRALVSAVTGIDMDVLKDSLERPALDTISISKRMSWASERVTTRPEDLAYCLLGIFGVSMPMLYGEGGREAFIRLQEHIMKDSDDQTLFAWDPPLSEQIARGQDHVCGLLASSPSWFKNFSDAIPIRDWQESHPYEMTNKGLRISLPVIKIFGSEVGALACRRKYSTTEALAFDLKSIVSGGDQYARMNSLRFFGVEIADLVAASRPGLYRTIYIRKVILHPTDEDLRPRGRSIRFCIAAYDWNGSTIEKVVEEVYPTDGAYTTTNGFELYVEPSVPSSLYWWSPRMWSWYKVLRFEMLGVKHDFYVVVGYNGLASEPEAFFWDPRPETKSAKQVHSILTQGGTPSRIAAKKLSRVTMKAVRLEISMFRTEDSYSYEDQSGCIRVILHVTSPHE